MTTLRKIKITFIRSLLIGLLFIQMTETSAQTIQLLQKNYSGEIMWIPETGTIRFETSGVIDFPWKLGEGKDLENDCKNHFWDIPSGVKNIVIARNTTVTGAFHIFSDLTIEGEDRETSVIYGTPLQTWADANNPHKIDLKEWYYAQIQNYHGETNINNLTMKDPFSYFVRGFGPVINMQSCNLIDTRDGHHNHSDGYCGGDGSLVKDCYFECGDDVFKAYFNYYVESCEIKMITNSVPIQLGWGNYSNGKVCNFKDLKIHGDSGRNASDNAVICGREGKYKVTINIDGLEIDNQNAVLVKLFKQQMTLNGNITNANIHVKSYDSNSLGIDNLIICGEKTRKNRYSCQ